MQLKTLLIGDLQITHHYNATSTSYSTATRTIQPPKTLTTLAEKGAKVITMGGYSLGIEIGGEVWALERPWHDDRAKDGYNRTLKQECWEYLRAAISASTSSAAAVLGSSKSDAKKAASQANGKKGGRPKNTEWENINWDRPTKEIATELGKSTHAVSQARKKYAPNTIIT